MLCFGEIAYLRDRRCIVLDRVPLSSLSSSFFSTITSIPTPTEIIAKMPSQKPRILIPGGAGYIGSHVALVTLLTRKYRVTGKYILINACFFCGLAR